MQAQSRIGQCDKTYRKGCWYIKHFLLQSSHEEETAPQGGRGMQQAANDGRGMKDY